MGNLSVLTRVVNKHGFAKLDTLVRHSKNNSLNAQDCRFAASIHKSLTLGTYERFKATFLSSKTGIAQIVANAVAPYLNSIRPRERSHARSRGVSASPSLSQRNRMAPETSGAASRSGSPSFGVQPAKQTVIESAKAPASS